MLHYRQRKNSATLAKRAMIKATQINSINPEQEIAYFACFACFDYGLEIFV
ncbi:hypothetical protein H1P_690011 [Hyella patelloides LEGE 07179]|uniref:Uncharacterized protein n=1 Tax=Hyella patelloides LEGE 07179 TaxID=945734 RepID=A0A563W327_9CYAN|nr:hypothetical protein H1P_690011 [Hyella patelloides LEGE 07179]